MMKNVPDIQKIAAILSAYSQKMTLCIREQRWEDLLTVLNKRQRFFESLDAHTEKLKAAGMGDIINRVLLEDNTLVSEVILQKEKLADDRLTLMRNRQAVKAYQ